MPKGSRSARRGKRNIRVVVITISNSSMQVKHLPLIPHGDADHSLEAPSESGFDMRKSRGERLVAP